MPPTEPLPPGKTLEEVVSQIGLYPIEAYDFVRRGLEYTVERIHANAEDPTVSRHVSGAQLCDGLREFALLEWGMLARTVLERWNIRRTIDFGRIVFALVDNGWMSKTDDDDVEDFRDVFDFKTAFDTKYRIEMKA